MYSLLRIYWASCEPSVVRGCRNGPLDLFKACTMLKRPVCYCVIWSRFYRGLLLLLLLFWGEGGWWELEWLGKDSVWEVAPKLGQVGGPESWRKFGEARKGAAGAKAKADVCKACLSDEENSMVTVQGSSRRTMGGKAEKLGQTT